MGISVASDYSPEIYFDKACVSFLTIKKIKV